MRKIFDYIDRGGKIIRNEELGMVVSMEGILKREVSFHTAGANKEPLRITQRFFDIALRAAQNDGKRKITLEGKKRRLVNEANRWAVPCLLMQNVYLSSVMGAVVEESFSFL
mgnify:CR=1 FL=1